MTREEEIHQEATLRYGQENQYMIHKAIAFCNGAQWADQHPVYFKGQTDKMQEHEVAFVKDWMKEYRGEMPTYADAIAWAEKRMIEKVESFLIENGRGQMIGRFNRFLEE